MASQRDDNEIHDVCAHYGFKYAFNHFAFTDGQLMILEESIKRESENQNCSIAAALEYIINKCREAMDILLRLPWNYTDEISTKIHQNNPKVRVVLKEQPVREKNPHWM